MTPPFVGALPLAIARERVDDIVAVTEDDIRLAMRLLLTRAKLCVEGSGAAAVAAVLAGAVAAPPDALVVAIVSGGNVDPERLLSLFEPAPAAAQHPGFSEAGRAGGAESG